MEQKDKAILRLTNDEEAESLISIAEHNWDRAATMLQEIDEDRRQGFFDDQGSGLMAALERTEQACLAVMKLMDHPQFWLLGRYEQRLEALANDKRMDQEIIYALGKMVTTPEADIKIVNMWDYYREKALQAEKLGGANKEKAQIIVGRELAQTLQHLFMQRYLQLMPPEMGMDVVGAVLSTTKELQNEKSPMGDAQSSMKSLEGKTDRLRREVHDAFSQITVSLLLCQTLMCTLHAMLKGRRKDAVSMDTCLKLALSQLMDSEGWADYWSQHMAHLGLQAHTQTLQTFLKNDHDESLAWLLSLPDYLYNKWEEEPKVFGRSLINAQLSDEQLLQLLFHLAKKEQAVLENSQPVMPQEQMEAGVIAMARRLDNFVSNRLFNQYDFIWEQITLNPVLSALLKQYSESKHNNGFNMHTFCNIVGYMREHYHMFPGASVIELATALDKSAWETFKKYIGEKSTTLTPNSLEELEKIIQEAKKMQ